MRVRRFCVAVLLLPLLATAQQRPVIPSLAETIDVSLVNVDVFVTNKSGERVRGLTKDDFEIFENGAKQPISNFMEFSSNAEASIQAEAKPAAPAPAPAASLQKRTLILFFDRIFLMPNHGAPFFASMKKMLHDTIRPGDRAMIVTWNRGILLTQVPFTDSLPALDRAIDSVAKLTSQRMVDVTAETRFMVDAARELDTDVFGANLSTNGQGLADMEMDSLVQLEKSAQERKIKAINALMRIVAATEGKKVMVLVTHRLSREAGAETYFANGQRDMLPLEKRSAIDMTTALKSIDNTANANGITIYPLFPEGLNAPLLDSADNAAVPVVDYQIVNNEMRALNEIAEETGGLAASGPDTTKLLPQVSEDLGSYYSIAYRVKNTGSDKARKIVVKTKNPAYVVRSRRDFMEKSDETRMEDRVIAALFRNPPSPGFALNVVVGKPVMRGRKRVLPMAIHVPISALTQLPDGKQYAGAFSVYFAWGGKLGGMSDTSHETRNYTIPNADIKNARESGHLTYTIDLAIDKNTERIGFGVVDEISKEYALRLMELPRN